VLEIAGSLLKNPTQWQQPEGGENHPSGMRIVEAHAGAYPEEQI